MTSLERRVWLINCRRGQSRTLRMVRAVLAPKSIEDQFIKRVRDGNDHCLVDQVMVPTRGPAMRACLCEDGRPGIVSCASPVIRVLGNI